jgi:hypothetical protein
MLHWEYLLGKQTLKQLSNKYELVLFDWDIIVNGNAFFKKQRRSERRERRSNAEHATNGEALFLY